MFSVFPQLFCLAASESDMEAELEKILQLLKSLYSFLGKFFLLGGWVTSEGDMWLIRGVGG
jgi:hypothetical protein